MAVHSTSKRKVALWRMYQMASVVSRASWAPREMRGR